MSAVVRVGDQTFFAGSVEHLNAWATELASKASMMTEAGASGRFEDRRSSEDHLALAAVAAQISTAKSLDSIADSLKRLADAGGAW